MHSGEQINVGRDWNRAHTYVNGCPQTMHRESGIAADDSHQPKEPMKRILVLLALLLASFGVTLGSTPSIASAYYGCGTTTFPPAYGNPGWAFTSCQDLNQSINEVQLATLTCAVYVGNPQGSVRLNPAGAYTGAWAHNDGEHSTVICPAQYPVPWILTLTISTWP